MTRNSKHLYLRLLGYVKPFWRTFAIAVVAMMVLAATEPAIPALLKPLLDGSFIEKDVSVANTVALLMILLFVIRGGASFLSAAGLEWVSGKLVMDLRARMFDKLVTLPASYFDHHPSGLLISKLTFNVAQVAEAGTRVLTILVRDTLAVLGLMAYMLYQDAMLTLISLGAAPLIIFIVRRVSSRLRRMSQHLQRSMGELTHVLEETIDGQRVVRVFDGQDYERTRFRGAANQVRRFQFKFAVAAAASGPVGELAAALSLAVIIFVAAQKSAAGQITVGGFVSFFAAMGMLFSPLKRLIRVNAPLQRGLAAAETVFQLIDEPSERDHGTRVLEDCAGALEFRNMSFTYDGAKSPALQELSVTIEPGETIALVGPSGAGKSTVASLVPRFYNPGQGQILLDGVDCQQLTLASLRKNIAFVSQDIVLFNDTVAANIGYGPMGRRPRNEVLAAARAAHAMEFIDNLPDGLDTLIGENGVRLSGGQRQRLAIARAFLKNAPILILDEATSSLDNASERRIQSALEELRRERTTLVIAHRLSTIEQADRILVMAGGRIAETGTHGSLLKESTLYAGLYRFQFSGGESLTQGDEANPGAS